MKKLYILFAFACLTCIDAAAKAPADSFYILGKDLLAKTIVAWSRDNGRLLRFTANDADINSIQKGDVIDVNLGLKKVTYLGSAVRNYAILQPDKAEPAGIVAILQVNGAKPITDIIRIKLTRPGFAGAGPRSDSLMLGADLINTIVNIQVDNGEPAGVISAQGKSGKAFRFSVPASIARNLKIGEPVYAELMNGFVIVQSGTGEQMSSYGYPIESGEGAGGEAVAEAKWIIRPVTAIKGMAGRVNLEFPGGTIRSFSIYTQDGKYLTSYSENSKTKFHTLAPGQYKITITSVPVMNVPVQSGKETRVKAGFLQIISEGDWSVYDESKETYYTSGSKPQKIVLPVGNYQLKFGGAFHSSPIIIKDGKTVEF